MKPNSPEKQPKPSTAAERCGPTTADSHRAGELLRAIIQGTAATTGTQFFRSLVKHLAEGLHVRFAFVAECLPNLRARSLAFFQDNHFGQNFEYALPGTPCLKVAEGRVCHVPDRLAEHFPDDKGMIQMGTVSYLGVPLRGSDGKVIGHLGALDDVERRHIESVLNQTNWMIEGERGAAKILNLNPSTLRSRMQKLGIRRPARVA